MFDVDLATYSMDQLVERQDKLFQRLNFAYHSGSPQLISSLQMLIGAVEREVTDRVAVDNARAVMASLPAIIESDPDLAQQHKKEVADQEVEDVKPEQQRRVRFRKSAVKLTPEDLDKDA